MTFSPFLRAFTICVLGLAALAAALLASNGQEFPAPQLSRSASFNEKARWARSALAEGRCDVLVVGSSMSLNAVDGRALAAGGARVVNLGSFGVTPEDTVRMLEVVLGKCRPRTVIMASYHGDFADSASDGKNVSWAVLKDYLSGGSPLAAHREKFDLFYLLKRTWLRRQLHLTDTYQTLAFDATGSVGLDCTNFKIEAGRWNADLTNQLPEIRPAALDAVAQIARMTRSVGASFHVWVSPLRPRAEAGFYPEKRAALWRDVAARIAPAGGRVLGVPEQARFTDADFADFAHLNRCGAGKWTRAMIAQMEGHGR